MNDDPINGFDPDKLADVIHGIQQTPATAKGVFKIRNYWLHKGATQSEAISFLGGRKVKYACQPYLQADLPLDLLGDGLALDSLDIVLHALASCITSSLVYHASLAGLSLQKVESEIEGAIDLRGFAGLSDDRVRNGYENIRVHISIAGDAPAEELKALTEKALSRSPVLDIMTHPVNVDISVDPESTTPALPDAQGL